MKQIEIVRIRVGSPEKLGVSIYAQGTNFAVEVEDGNEASLILYEKNGEKAQEIPFPDNSRVGNVLSLFIEKFDCRKYEYVYRIGDKIQLDPYALRICNGRCGFDTEDYELVQNTDRGIPFEEMILYKLHVRGFTQNAGGRIKKKGTFRGIEESITYFQELGINAIEFMPMYEWSEILSGEETVTFAPRDEEGKELTNYWGYAQNNYYFAPKAAYAAKDSVRECRQMIQSLHHAGIECIMEFYFPRGINPLLAVDALIHWKLHYNVDGFHLIGEGVPVEAIIRTPVLKNTKLFFERVDEEWIYGNKQILQRSIAEYNKDFMNCGRRLLKGDDSQISNFLYQCRKNPDRHGVVNFMANVDGFTLYDMVSYDRKHNEANGEDNQDGVPANDVWNCGAEGPTRKQTVRALRLKQMKNAMLYTLMAQGTPLIYQGDEMGNSQMGNNNAYAMDNPVGWVNWKLTAQNKEFFQFVKEMIGFRKAHPILHQKKALRMTDYKAYGYPDLSYHDERAWYTDMKSSSRNVGCMYCGKYAHRKDGTEDDFIYVAYNAYWENKSFALPRLPEDRKWAVAVQTERAELTGLKPGDIILDQKTLEVTPRTVIVLTAIVDEKGEEKV